MSALLYNLNIAIIQYNIIKIGKSFLKNSVDIKHRVTSCLLLDQ